ncbi:MAG TPA: TolC family protein, partial [Flavobacteriales bacterium]|nr:TolC family protein [Flavobacteriales bacterium]
DVPVSTRDSLGLVDLSLLRPSDSLAMDPRLHELDLRMDAALSQAEAARRMGAPRMGLGIDYVVVDERTDMDLPDNGRDVIMPMFSVSLPIYRSKYRSGVEEAEALQRSYELLRVQRGNDLAAAYETARYEAYKAARMAQLMDAQIAVNERILELLLAAYSGNGSDFEEVLRTQQQLLRQRLMRLSALREHHAAIARIDLLTAK